jgi:hypothetical protein
MDTGRPVITERNAIDFSRVLGGVIEDANDNKDDGQKHD